MPGFSGATGVPLKQMQDAIAQSTAKYVDYTVSGINASAMGYYPSNGIAYSTIKSGLTRNKIIGVVGLSWNSGNLFIPQLDSGRFYVYAVAAQTNGTATFRFFYLE